jgi:hypothetical protein
MDLKLGKVGIWTFDFDQQPMAQVLAKLHAHFEAGADHVCIQVLGSEPGTSPIQSWRDLAKAMLH